jgi:hypothetical protein
MTPQSGAATSQPPARELVGRLRQLRSDARRLHSSSVEDLAPFQKKDKTFSTWPGSIDPPISVATTSTALMALIGSGEQGMLFSDSFPIGNVYRAVVAAVWQTSGLKDLNAFTTALVVRAAGFLVRGGITADKAVARLKHSKQSLEEIVRARANLGTDAFKVLDYPPKTALGYWFIDGTIAANMRLRKAQWKIIADWAATEFRRELIYVSAGNDSLMDPPSLAMAACLINRIRRFSAQAGTLADISRDLPSPVELGFGIEQVFAKQSGSGIWHKYFPLFHFPQGQGAADYCFTFEFLEAILIEFGTDVLKKPELLDGFERAVRWCDKYRLVFQHEGRLYRGWNSGGEVKNLAAGKPESWATATVHMFLTQLERKVGDLLDELVLKRFERDRAAVVHSSERLNEKIIDIDLTFFGERPTTLLTVIREEIIAQAPDTRGDPLYKPEVRVPHSALLFGAPGTSKTNLARAIAEALGWPLIVITPSEFLAKGLEQVHAQVDEVFGDLMDLSYAVIFFDEMDALAQTRGGEDPEDGVERTDTSQGASDQRTRAGVELDVTRQLLTTSMLPKLANLWEQKRVIFLMATNHRQQLDPAITRPGRFDLLLCVASPTWENKIAITALERIFSVEHPERVNAELARLTPKERVERKALDRLTVTEVGIFLDHLKRSKGTADLAAALSLFKPHEFKKVVSDWAQKSITLREGCRITKEYGDDLKASRRQYYPNQN